MESWENISAAFAFWTGNLCVKERERERVVFWIGAIVPREIITDKEGQGERCSFLFFYHILFGNLTECLAPNENLACLSQSVNIEVK